MDASHRALLPAILRLLVIDNKIETIYRKTIIMSTNTKTDVATIARRAKRLRIFVIALMILMPSALAAIWLRPRGLHIEYRGHPTVIDPIIAACGVTLFLEVALFELARMLSLIAAGEYYSIRVVRHFRSFALWLLVLALLSFFAHMLQPSADRAVKIAIGIDFRELLTVGLTLLLFLLSRLLERAGEIEQENREIV